MIPFPFFFFLSFFIKSQRRRSTSCCNNQKESFLFVVVVRSVVQICIMMICCVSLLQRSTATNNINKLNPNVLSSAGCGGFRGVAVADAFACQSSTRIITTRRYYNHYNNQYALQQQQQHKIFQFPSPSTTTRTRTTTSTSASLLRLFSSKSSSSSSSTTPSIIEVEISPTDHNTKPLKNFHFITQKSNKGLQNILKKQNWIKPTKIQSYAIPLLQNNYDVMASSQTGSGKSLMFCLPLLDKLLNNNNNHKRQQQQRAAAGAVVSTPSALIISPTRELAIQTSEVLKILCQPTSLKVSLATGGDDWKRQRQQLSTTDILVGTPGRILQFADSRQLALKNNLQYLIIDECDRLLDLGFEPQMTRISKLLPKIKVHQSVLCSATFPLGVQRIAADFLDPNYYFVSIGKVGSTESKIQQQLEWIDTTNNGPRQYQQQQQQQENCVLRHIKTFLKSVDSNDNNNNINKAGGDGQQQSSVLVFSNTKEGADSLGKALAKQRSSPKIKYGVIHGDKIQSERNRVLDNFRSGKISVLIATDVAARGLDISSVGLVIQADAPRSIDTYTHRVGRTGRAGMSGKAITLLDNKCIGIASGLIDLLNEANQENSIPSWLVGMSYISQARELEEAELLFAGSGGQRNSNSSSNTMLSSVEIIDGDVEEGSSSSSSSSETYNEKFTSQDFRRTAAEGSYGAGRDLAYRSFDDDAYRTDNDESFIDNDMDGTAEQKIIEVVDIEGKEDILDDQIQSDIVREDMGNGHSTSFSSDDEMTLTSFKRRTPSSDLKRAIKELGGSLDFDRGPDKSVFRSLSRRKSNQKLRFEYLGMFPFDQVAPLLMTANNNQQSSNIQNDSSRANNKSLPQVLMVAEKPSIAKAIADALSGNRGPRTRRGLSRALPVYEFTTDAFEPIQTSTASDDGDDESASNRRCVVTVTSVIGHVFSLSFDTMDNNNQQGQQNYNRPSDYFHLPVAKQEETSSSKVRVVDHLRALAGKSDHLVLWLDCDPEGENIAHEVIAVVRRAIEANSQDDSTDDRIHRARFSAITPKALRDAFSDLRKPDAALSRSVDARQELDLRVGVAFTRLLTWKTVGLARKRFNPATRVVSYGPCQTPALSFCVDRAHEIEKFKPQDFWTVKVDISAPGEGNKKLPVTWVVRNGEEVVDTRKVAIRRRQSEATTQFIENATFKKDLAKKIVSAAAKPGSYAIATNIESKHETISPPLGLNTVALLEAGSKAMGMSPKQVMNVAEKLYSAGFISYPRTETTKYDPNGFDVRAILRDHSRHELWGKSCSYLLRKKYSKSGRPPSRGRDVGDHPPITPLKVATRQEVGGGAAWRVYEFVTRNFLGSLHDNLSYTRRVVSFEVNNESGTSPPSSADFSLEYVSVDSLGFADCCRWVLNDIGASKKVESQFSQGGKYSISSSRIETGKTRPPRFLQEHELILLMDENRIGTDASMAVHVNNIVERGYVQLCDETGVPLRPPRPPRPGQKPLPRQIGRYMVPTSLGMELLDLFGRLDEDSNQAVPALLSKPAIRRQMEEEVKQIAVGDLDKDECVGRNLRWFHARHEELSDSLTRDRINEFGSGLSQTRDTLRYWRRLDVFEGTNKSDNGISARQQHSQTGRKTKGAPRRTKDRGQAKNRRSPKHHRDHKSKTSSSRSKRGGSRPTMGSIKGAKGAPTKVNSN